MKTKQFSYAKLLYGSTAYCDQWGKVMAIYDDSNTLRGVIIENSDSSEVTILLIGDTGHKVYIVNGIEIGTTTKNMKACFDIFYTLQRVCTPEYFPYDWRKKSIEVKDIFTHTRTAAIRHGGFHAIDDAKENISKALEIATPILASSDSITMLNHYAYENNDYCHDDIEYPGDMPCKMRHIGDGVWCDDEGDNWDFY